MCSVLFLNHFYVSLVIGDSDTTITDIIANFLGISRYVTSKVFMLCLISVFIHPWKCIENCDACMTCEICNLLWTIIIALDCYYLLK